MGKMTRMTRQKKTILEILQSTKSHPPADWVYEQARKKLPDISLGTVYRNLKLLKETGFILELNYGSAYSRYDANPLAHYHFVCEKCNRIYDVELPLQKSIDVIASEATGALILGHRLEFYGICNSCQNNN